MLNKNEFDKRVIDLGRENLKFIYGIMKAISLAAGAIVFMNVLILYNSVGNVTSPAEFVFKLFILANSWMVAIVSYDGVITSLLFLTHLPTFRESLYTFFLVCLEFILFVVIDHRTYLSDDAGKIKQVFQLDISNYWFLFFGLNAFLANRMLTLTYSVRFMDNVANNKDIQAMVKAYINGTRPPRLHSLVTALTAIIVFITICLFRNSCCVQEYCLQLTFSILFLPSMIFMFIMQHKGRISLLRDYRIGSFTNSDE